MKKKIKTDIKAKSSKELLALLSESLLAKAKAKIDISSGKTRNTSLARETSEKVAFIRTIIREKELNEAN